MAPWFAYQRIFKQQFHSLEFFEIFRIYRQPWRRHTCGAYICIRVDRINSIREQLNNFVQTNVQHWRQFTACLQWYFAFALNKVLIVKNVFKIVSTENAHEHTNI